MVKTKRIWKIAEIATYLAIGIDSAILLWLASLSYQAGSGPESIANLIIFPVISVVALDAYMLFDALRRKKQHRLWLYYSITRALLMVILAYNISTWLNDPFTSGQASVKIICVVMVMFLIGGAIYPASKLKAPLLALILSFILAITASTYLYGAAYGLQFAESFSEQRTDEQSSYDFRLLREKIMGYEAEQGRLPRSLNDIRNTNYVVDERIYERWDKYEYKPAKDGKSYKLCTHFMTGTGSHEEEDSYGHEAGYQCITYKTFPDDDDFMVE